MDDLVLIIDDNKIDRLINRLVVQNAGLSENPLEYEDAARALDYLKQGSRPAKRIWIFLDLNMPGMDGQMFLKEAQNLERPLRELLIIVVVSSTVNPGEITSAETHPLVRSFETKPLTLTKVKAFMNDRPA